jgi:hypothetical protein
MAATIWATNQANSVTGAVINVAVASYLVWPLSPPGTLYAESSRAVNIRIQLQRHKFV